MTIYKTFQGAYRIERRIDDNNGGYIFKMQYFGYNLAEAKSKFRADFRNHIASKLQ
jgi:hypothetical protein